MLSDEVILSIAVIFFIMLMALIPPFAQFKITDVVNAGAFKSIRIKKLAFMFRSPGGASVSKDGIPTPMLIVQIVGYVVALLSMILNILLLIFLEEPLKIMATTTIFILVSEVILLIIFVAIVGIISKH